MSLVSSERSPGFNTRLFYGTNTNEIISMSYAFLCYCNKPILQLITIFYLIALIALATF